MIKRIISTPIYHPQLLALILLILLSNFTFGSANISILELMFALIFLFLLYNSFLVSFIGKSMILKSTILITSLFFISTIIISLIPAMINGVEISLYIRRAFPFFLLFSFVPTFNIIEIKKESINTLLLVIIVVCLYDALKVLFPLYRNLNQIYLIMNLEDIRIAGNGVLQVSFPIILISLLLSTRKKVTKIVLKVFLFLSLSSLILSFTRSYWLGFFSALFLLIVILKREDKAKLIKILFSQLVLFIFTFFILLIFKFDLATKILSWLKDRIFSITQLTFLPTFIGRVDELETLLEYIPKSPIYGFGLGATYNFYNLSPFAWGGVGYKDLFYSHNFYAYHLFATGILGLLCFFLFIVTPIKVGILTYSTKKTQTLTLLAVFLSSIIFGTLFTSLTSPQFVDATSNIVIGVYIGIIAYASKYAITNIP